MKEKIKNLLAVLTVGAVALYSANCVGDEAKNNMSSPERGRAAVVEMNKQDKLATHCSCSEIKCEVEGEGSFQVRSLEKEISLHMPWIGCVLKRHPGDKIGMAALGIMSEKYWQIRDEPGIEMIGTVGSFYGADRKEHYIFGDSCTSRLILVRNHEFAPMAADHEVWHLFNNLMYSKPICDKDLEVLNSNPFVKSLRGPTEDELREFCHGRIADKDMQRYFRDHDKNYKTEYAIDRARHIEARAGEAIRNFDEWSWRLEELRKGAKGFYGELEINERETLENLQIVGIEGVKALREFSLQYSGMASNVLRAVSPEERRTADLNLECSLSVDENTVYDLARGVEEAMDGYNRALMVSLDRLVPSMSSQPIDSDAITLTKRQVDYALARKKFIDSASPRFTTNDSLTRRKMRGAEYAFGTVFAPDELMARKFAAITSLEPEPDTRAMAPYSARDLDFLGRFTFVYKGRRIPVFGYVLERARAWEDARARGVKKEDFLARYHSKEYKHQPFCFKNGKLPVVNLPY